MKAEKRGEKATIAVLVWPVWKEALVSFVIT
jgi:hypothetical protein